MQFAWWNWNDDEDFMRDVDIVYYNFDTIERDSLQFLEVQMDWKTYRIILIILKSWKVVCHNKLSKKWSRISCIQIENRLFSSDLNYCTQDKLLTFQEFYFSPPTVTLINRSLFVLKKKRMVNRCVLTLISWLNEDAWHEFGNNPTAVWTFLNTKNLLPQSALVACRQFEKSPRVTLPILGIPIKPIRLAVCIYACFNGGTCACCVYIVREALKRSKLGLLVSFSYRSRVNICAVIWL